MHQHFRFDQFKIGHYVIWMYCFKVGCKLVNYASVLGSSDEIISSSGSVPELSPDKLLLLLVLGILMPGAVAVAVAVALLAIGVRTAGSEPLKCNTGVLLFDADVELVGIKKSLPSACIDVTCDISRAGIDVSCDTGVLLFEADQELVDTKKAHQKLALMLAGTPLLLHKSHLILTYAHYLLIVAAD
jgi:hypothetical protein